MSGPLTSDLITDIHNHGGRKEEEMRKVNQKATKILEKLTAGLGVGEGRKIDNTDGTYMAVHVDRLSKDFYSVAHYYEQNGDLMADPDVVYWKDDEGAWRPTEYTQHGLGLRRQVLWVEDGKASKWNRYWFNDLCVFTGTWMANIKSQQGL